MDLSNFVTYDKKPLLLSIAESNQNINENTHSKPQETLEFEMNKQKEFFSFDIPLELPEKWMMGVTSLELYNTVYNNTEKNNKIKFLGSEKIVKIYETSIEKISKIKKLPEASNIQEIRNYKKYFKKDVFLQKIILMK